jgi:tetratricopeptide (TPR) repeat protein
MTWLAAVLVVLTGLAVTAAPAAAQTPPAPADEPPESENDRRARELYEKGNTHYDLAEYDLAIAAFKEAYTLSNRPALLYNIAQAYRQKGDCENALKFYQNYLRLDPQSSKRKKVEERIVEMDTCVKDPARQPKELPKEAIETPKEVVDPPPPPIIAEPGPRRGKAKKLAGLVGGGVGVALMITGGYFHTVADGKEAEIEAACETSCDFADPEIASIDADGKRAQRNAIVLYSVGGAAAIGGAVLYFWGRSEASSADTRVSFTPLPGGSFVAVSGRF